MNYGTGTTAMRQLRLIARTSRLIRWLIPIAFCMLPLPSVAQHATERPGQTGYAPTRVPSVVLPNAMWVHESLLSGGMPHGEEAFEELVRYGIRTIISVDGIRPDVLAASKHGIRYVHLPHGYDGISKDRQLEIAKAIRDLPKPIYIHCHHGRHRSPSAAAAACVNLGWMSPESGLIILKEAGTNPAYRGLYQSVEQAAEIKPSQLDDMQANFPSVADLPPLVDSMVAMDALFDRLKESQNLQWKAAIASALDKNPLPDVLALKEYYIELHRSESQAHRDHEFLDFLGDGRVIAEELEEQLISMQHRTMPSEYALKQVRSTMQRLQTNCAQCHAQFRDNRGVQVPK